MKKNVNVLLSVVLGLVLFILAIPKQAYSIVDLRAGYSFGNLYDDGSKFAKESGLDFQVLFQIIPIIPVAFDIGYSMHKIDLDEEGIEDLDYSKAALGITAWIPFIPLITPFATVKFIPWQDVDGDAISLKPGYGMMGGVKVSIVPLLNMYGAFNWEQAKGKSEGDFRSMYGTIGVELSL